ncbi:MAG: dephospho-CoA kinase [Thermodesulfobacteriota bacterium]|nr:dephospho-CoA kinase [Thermodesulfobacteriota bacterium]
MLNIGLTGGIASGKSTVAKLFQEKGAYLIDFDVLVRSVEEPGAPAWKRIVENFGTEILSEDGTIDREKLGAIVFRDKEKLEKLNGIVHPFVFEEWERQIADIKKKNPNAIVISDIPLLIEVGKVDEVDMVVLVYISQEEQIRRLMERDGCSREDALVRIDSQMSIDEKLWYSDFVVDNGGLLEDIVEQVDDIWERLLDREKQL